MALFVVALGTVLFLADRSREKWPAAGDAVPSSAALTAAPLAPEPLALVSTADRVVFPYSIIEGGAHSVGELKQAIAADTVVAAHYANFDVAKTRVVRLEAPKLAHVSYRMGNSVFWTRKPVLLPAGEAVLTDGVHIARTRCGNQLSDLPGEVAAAEPPAAVLNTPLTKQPATPAPIVIASNPQMLPGVLTQPLLATAGHGSFPGAVPGGAQPLPAPGGGMTSVQPPSDNRPPESAPGDEPGPTEPPFRPGDKPEPPRPTGIPPAPSGGQPPLVWPELPPTVPDAPPPGGQPPLVWPELPPTAPDAPPESLLETRSLPPDLDNPEDPFNPPGGPGSPRSLGSPGSDVPPDITPVPEPGTAVLMLGAAAACAARRFRARFSAERPGTQGVPAGKDRGSLRS